VGIIALAVNFVVLVVVSLGARLVVSPQHAMHGR
jgi:hypothetical protein